MKKTYIALAVLAMAALAGCQTEEFRNDSYTPKEGEVLIRVSNSDKTTKSADFSTVVKGETIDLGTDAEGTNYVLEETITNLNDLAFAPATKGTPGYTENFHPLYGGFNAAVYKGSSVYEADGAFEVVDESKLIYKRKYPNDIWDKDNESAPNLYFFLRTPADYIDANTTGLTYSASDGKITFNYTSPATASKQEDMLFTSRPLTSADDFNKLFVKADEGLPVLFHHALTGVKFAIAADVKDKVTITGVKFTGLADGGKCVVTPRQEAKTGYKDNKTGDYSSDSVSVWNPSDLVYGGTEFSQTFSGVVSYESAGEGIAHFGESFYLAGDKNNLNDTNASETFWFIPQPMTDNVKLTISYKIDGVAQPDWEIDFGTTIKGKRASWLAGELHTYTLKVDAVKVHIEDVIQKANTDTTKTGVTITNTGNTKAFIRATIIGNWCSENGEAVFGYTDFIDNPGEYVEIPSWTIENTGGGVFVGLPGQDWVRAKDGFFYYKIAVEPSAATGSALFTSYTPPTEHPNYQIAGKNVKSHFVMEIATQAVNANNLDGTTMSWQEAWAKALGTAPATN